MAETVQGVIDSVLNEANVDATQAQVLRDLNRRWAQMLSDARAYRKTVSIGTTTSGTAFYATPVIELYYLTVDGVPYGLARRPDIYSYGLGALVWVGPDGGLAVADASSAAVKGLTLVPTPTTTGLAIAGFAAVEPPDLTADATGDALLVAQLERDLLGALTAGVMADRYWFENRPDLAGLQEQRFADGVTRLRARAARRFRNAGPSQIRVLGINA